MGGAFMLGPDTIVRLLPEEVTYQDAQGRRHRYYGAVVAHRFRVPAKPPPRFFACRRCGAVYMEAGQERLVAAGSCVSTGLDYDPKRNKAENYRVPCGGRLAEVPWTPKPMEAWLECPHGMRGPHGTAMTMGEWDVITCQGPVVPVG